MGGYHEAIGSVILNFGSLEALSYHWIRELARDDLLFEQATKLNFAQRCRLAQKLIRREEQLSLEVREKAEQHWGEAMKRARLRNQIAHNPLMFGWHSPADLDKGPPDFIGVPNLRDGRFDHLRRPIKLDELRSEAERVSELVGNLARAFENVLKLRPGKTTGEEFSIRPAR